MRAAVFRGPHRPLTIEQVEVGHLGDDEVLVATRASGVCHSDLHFIDGHMSAGSAVMVMGHEGAGVVQAVGGRVTAVGPGDHVVACLSGFCGRCPQCLGGHPNLCRKPRVSRPRGAEARLSQDGEPLVQFANLSTFAEQMLVHENSVVAVDPAVPFAVAALLGCGVLTGMGAALRTARVRAGQTVAVFGCGGVGLAIVQGARLAGAGRIIAVDLVDAKLELARRLGATDGVNGADGGAVEQVRGLTAGHGVDHAFEAVGIPTLMRQAIEVLGVRGTATICGVWSPGSTLELPLDAIHPECRIQTSRMGSNRFKIDIPVYLGLYLQGRLDLDELVSARISLDEVNDAFTTMRTGELARTVIEFPASGEHGSAETGEVD